MELKKQFLRGYERKDSNMVSFIKLALKYESNS
jgi:hypothetical protein